LYDKVYRADILRHAYNLVRANKGNAGIDGITFKAIESKEGGNRLSGGAGRSTQVLYAKYGLYKVLTSAGWTKAHALQ
jgi:hypothetical protein